MTPPIKIIAKRSGDVALHTIISSYEGNNIANATHIIESRNVLVVIDSQFYKSYAEQFKTYIDSLGKPVARLYISHRHPDHWFGLAAGFADMPIYALPETKDFIQKNGKASREDHLEKMGNEAPDSVVVPQYTVSPGVETIDGVTYAFKRVVDTEIDYLLTIKLPDLGVHIVQDLIYSGTHLYLTANIPHWIDILEEMLLSEDELFLPGHGLPADKKEVAENVKYLAAGQEAIDNGLKNNEFKAFMIKKFPARECPGIFDIYIPRLFDGGNQY